jgi:DNA-binding response OmpR family regulator
MQSVGDDDGRVAATVVLAENDAGLRLIYGDALRRAGHVVWEASNGALALRLVRAHAPDLLLLGIWMPVLNGLEVLEQLDGTPEAVGLKVVVLSDRDDADTQLEALALGVESYWRKDMPVDELCKRIHELIRPARILREHPE